MLEYLKKVLYFPAAYYFRFFAQMQLNRWRPRTIVVTGSTGKTTLLHLIESQLGQKARYSHHANSAYGIPFHILGLERETFTVGEFLSFFLKAPFCLLKKTPKEKLYVVEADCDRPGEGKFLASLLQPEVTLWISVSKTHSMNFDHLVDDGRFASVEDAIAHEFGYFIEYASRQIIVNGDYHHIVNQLPRTRAEVKLTSKKRLDAYEVSPTGSQFVIEGKPYRFRYLLPEVAFYSLSSCLTLMEILRRPIDASFPRFILPPGRSSLFTGVKNTTIVDSTYNASLASVKAVLDLFKRLPFARKWAVIGDMLEQGKQEKGEHERLAEVLAEASLERVLLIGRLTSTYTYPYLTKISRGKTEIKKYLKLTEAAEDLKANLAGGEALLFKGSQSMLLEALIEPILEDKNDIRYLPRQETIWRERKNQRLGVSYCFNSSKL